MMPTVINKTSQTASFSVATPVPVIKNEVYITSSTATQKANVVLLFNRYILIKKIYRASSEKNMRSDLTDTRSPSTRTVPNISVSNKRLFSLMKRSANARNVDNFENIIILIISSVSYSSIRVGRRGQREKMYSRKSVYRYKMFSENRSR